MEEVVPSTSISELKNPKNGVNESNKKPKIVVIMGPTGSGKSKLAIDLATLFPIEIINADSMQVYHTLDVLTNKVPIFEQKGVPHHLLGTISPNVEFTSKDFRDAAIPLIVTGSLVSSKHPDQQSVIICELLRREVHLVGSDIDCSYINKLINDIISRNHLPVVVGGTNFYIQALVSPFLYDDSMEEVEDFCIKENSGSEHNPDSSSIDVANQQELQPCEQDRCDYSYDQLRDLDPVAANRIHPNDCRKIRQYLEMFARSGVLPSQLFQGKMTENWGRLGNSRYNCCFVCVDASLPVLDRFVDQRVDRMMEAGLLNEVYKIYNMNADYTKGLCQAIGVREFEDFLCAFMSEMRKEGNNFFQESASMKNADISFRQNVLEVISSSSDTPNRLLLEEAISKLKLNTRRLVRRQKRRINRLETLFGWNIHHVDSTESLLGSSEDTWITEVVQPAAKVINSFLSCDVIKEEVDNVVAQKLNERDLWTRYTCKVCDKVLRGAHEWEQHKQGRAHRKRTAKLKKYQGSFSANTLQASIVDHLD